jgi:subtilase family serine protease
MSSVSFPALRPRFSRIILGIFALVLLSFAVPAPTQTPEYIGGQRTRALVVQPVDESRLVSLEGNTHPSAIAENDRGAVADAMPLEHMQLQLQRPPELEKELEKLIDEMHRKGSPRYHHWLTAKQFGSRFGVSPGDMDKVTGWLHSHGFRVDSILPSGMAIEFSGTAGQVKETFHTQIHNLDVDGEHHFANMSDPKIPAALTGVVVGVHALHNFMPHSMIKRRPKFTFNDTSSDTWYAVVPADLATIYNLNPAFANGITGLGQTVVVIEDTNIANSSDISTFRSAFGLSGFHGTFSQVNPPGSTTCSNPAVNGDEDEAALDAEWAGASAPDANVELAACADTTTVFGGLIALQNLINGATPPPIVSISYGECEAQNGATANQTYVNTYQQAAAEGVSVFVSSGDEGAASCDANRTVATHGVAVSGFTSTPYNVSVGGTDFGDTYESLNGGPAVSTYWSTSNSVSDGSALSYMPEIPWNDSCAGKLLYTVEGYVQGYGSTGFCNSANGKADFRTTASGSGGPSAFSAKPSWQTVLGNPADNVRDIPDVSLFAANGLWNHFLEYCLTDSAEGGVPCDYSNTTDALDLAAGGTSFASPIMAGIQALVNQSQGGPQGNPNYVYYALANAEYGPAGNSACNSSLGTGVAGSCVFYDITLGDMDVNCTGTTAASDCYNASGTGKNAVDGVLSTATGTLGIAYGTNTGWDFSTGIGSVNAYNLILNWNGAQTTTAVASSANPSGVGQLVTFTATVTSPLGAVNEGTVVWSPVTGCAASTVVAGVATCVTSTLPPGQSTVTGSYSWVPYPSSAYSNVTGFKSSNGSVAGGQQVIPQVNVTVGTAPAGLAFSIDGTPYTSAQIQSWAVGAQHTLTTSPSQSGAGVQYTFTAWSDGTPTPTDIVTASSAVASYTANFSSAYLLSAAANNPAYGTVTPATGAYYAPGTVVNLTAAPNPGYYFTGWTGSADIASASSAGTTITMNRPETVTANFAPIPILVVTTSADDSGSASNCTVQSTPGTGTDASCSLRDALLAAANLSAGNISFASTAFNASNSAAQNTITLSNGTLNLPSNTSVAGATSGVGAALTNLVTVNGANANTVFNVNPGVTKASLSGLTIANGSASGTIGEGGGILNAGTLTVSNCTFSGNSSNGSVFGYGGAIFNFSTLTVTGSTFSGNTATGVEESVGGGIYTQGILTVIDSTFSGNSAAGDGVGGGIANGGTMTLINVTLSGNTALVGGGVLFNGGSPSSVSDSIVAGNSASYGPDTDGSFTDNGGNQIGVAAIALAPLGSYGGPTQTMVPLPGSPAICAVPQPLATASGISSDQRGLPFNPVCTAGAIDSGAAQTNYAMRFTTEPPSIANANVALSPAPVVSLTESGAPAVAATGSVAMTDSNSVLGGTAAASLAAGSATFSNLTLSSNTSNDLLTATLPLTPSINLTAVSTGVSIAGTAQTVSFTPPAAAQYGNPPINLPSYASASSGLTVSFSVVSGPGNLTGSVLNITGTGQIVVQASQAGNSTYSAAAPVQQTITVSPAVLKVAAFNYTRAYDAALPASFAYSVTGFVNGDTIGVVSGAPSVTSTAVPGSGAGSYPITPALGSLSAANYTFQFANGALTITQAVLKVAAYNYNRAYGAALPAAYAYSISGFLNGDTIGVVSGTPAITTTAVQGSGAGSYPITPTLGSLSAANYTFQFANGTLAISPVSLTVTAYNYTRIYGAALPATYAYSISGFVNGDTIGVVSGAPSIATAAHVGSSAGTYPITPSLGSLSSGNYTFQFANGTLTIAPAVLKVTPFSYSRNYPATLPATFSYSITGFLNGDTQSVVSGTPSITTTATPSSPVGAYPINATAGSLAAANYTFSFVPGTLTIAQAVLTVTPYSYTRVYGTALPATFAYSITGFVNGDTIGVVSGTAAITTTAIAGSPVNSYPITAALGSLSATNYTFQFASGALNITPAVLKVTAFNYTRVYNTPLPNPFAYSITGFVGTDTISAVSGAPAISTTAVQGSATGPYPIIVAQGTLSAANYTFTYVNGTLTITP